MTLRLAGLLGFLFAYACQSIHLPPIPQACTQDKPCPYFTEVTPERLISLQKVEGGLSMQIKTIVPTQEGIHVVAKVKGSTGSVNFFFIGKAPRDGKQYITLSRQVKTLLLAGNKEEAFQKMVTLHQWDPSDPEINRLMAEQYLREGDWEKASKHINLMVQFAPWYEQTYQLQGDLAMALGDQRTYQEAMERYKALIGVIGR